MARNPAVDDFLDELDHPLLDAIRATREAILAADERVTEDIKWKSPTFAYRGNIASIEPRVKKQVSVLFHRGAEIPGRHPILTGGGETARYVRLDDLAEVEARRAQLQAVIKAWCDWRDTDGA